MYLYIFFSGAAYGKLVGGGAGPLSSYRYSPYPMPSMGGGHLTAGSLQYTHAQSPVSQTTPAVLSAITSPTVVSQAGAAPQTAAANSDAAHAQPEHHLTAAAHAHLPAAHQLHQQSAAAAQLQALQGLYPYQFATGLPGNLDLASMYSLPPTAGMYTL